VNRVHPNLTFTPTQEENNSISFPDLLITRQPQGIEIDIYRKPTTTDTTINFASNHPMEHKMAAYRYLINRMTNLPLSAPQKKTEWHTILKIARSNNFPTSTIKKLKKKMGHKTPTEKKQHDKKWTSFTYHTPSIRKITKLFKQTNVRITFRSTNTIHQKTRQKRKHYTRL
jgi:hypothetical protein